MNRKEEPLYMISVVARMLHVHPQTLRLYEREGFVTPKRDKKQRLYSERDVERLGFIIQLTREMGVNKAGVEIILRMRNRLDAVHRQISGLLDDFHEAPGHHGPEEFDFSEFERRLKRIFFEDEDAD
ncbi:MAG: MerR family transcriptional regulator [Actinomycetota bacterium]|nr:MerR family transcriptional regulator [Actinomycetota bacterium]